MGKILILANNDIGLYKFRKELILELLKENEVFVSLPYGEFVEKLIDLGCKFIITNISRRGTNPLIDLKLIIKYRKIIKNTNPDVVLTYTIKPNVYGGIICRFRNIPYIANITGLGTAVDNGGFLQHFTLLLYKLALKNATCVFFQNKDNAKFLNNNINIKGKQQILPGSGVNVNEYKLMDYPDDKVINFLFIARVMKQKGIDQYIDTAEYVKKRYKNTKFNILGDFEESYQAKLKEFHDEGIIEYHGMQNDVKKFHEISHCTIHPTYYPEGMSNVLLETAACGRPIITTNRSGCREIVDDEINGYLVEQQNTQDLIEKTEKFLALSYAEKRKMGLAGRAKVEKEFDRQLVIDAYLEEIKIIQHCIGEVDNES